MGITFTSKICPELPLLVRFIHFYVVMTSLISINFFFSFLNLNFE